MAFNGPAQVAHIGVMGQWAQDGKFIYAGRRNEGGANFRAGECALFTESSAGYAGIKAEAQFDFEVRPLPYWTAVASEPQNTIIGGASLHDGGQALAAEVINDIQHAEPAAILERVRHEVE